MTLLDRYIFRSVLGTCIAAVCLFAFVLLAGSIVRDLLGKLLTGQLLLWTFGKLVLLSIPVVISYALPLGMLTAVLLTLGRLSSDSEVTAMRAAGLSVPRIAAPVLVLAALGVLLGLRVNFDSMPKSKIRYERDLEAALRANPLSFIVPKTFIRDFPGIVVYVGSKQGPDIRDIWVWKLDHERRVYEFIHAESGRVDYDAATNEFVIPLSNAHLEAYDRKAPDDFTQPLKVSTAGDVDPVRLPLAEYFGTETVHQKAQWMTYSELKAEKARIEALPVPPGGERQHERDLMKVSLTLQDKMNLALAIFSFALIGVPLGIRVSRRETSANLGVAVALALGYYLMTTMVGALDRHPEYRPDLLLWIPNLVFLALGFLLLRRLDRA